MEGKGKEASRSRRPTADVSCSVSNGRCALPRGRHSEHAMENGRSHSHNAALEKTLKHKQKKQNSVCVEGIKHKKKTHNEGKQSSAAS